MPDSSASKLSAARIALGYAIIGTLWVSFSDVAVTHLHLYPPLLTIKGVAYVLVTAVLLHLTIRRLLDDVQRTSRERDETANLHRTVVEASGEGICLLNESGQISFLNGRLAAMVGLPSAELEGRLLTDLVEQPESPADAPSQTRASECRLRTRSGEPAWALVSTTPLLDAAGLKCGSLVMFLDVTERKRLEAELRHSQKLEALGSFAGGITHDFKNLMAIVGGYGALLEKQLPPESQEGNAAREILSACERGSLLIRQLLAFSRKQTIVAEVVEVGPTIRRFAEVLPRIVGEHIEVSVAYEDRGSCVRMGAGQIEQILMNLAANARDAMPQGGHLNISTNLVELAPQAAWAQGISPGPQVAIAVSDTGTGIDPSLQARIFEPFFTTKPAGTGTGLGLSTVYAIAAQNGGFVHCSSVVGTGTTFTLYLPATQETCRIQEDAAVAGGARFGTETVLLVEDEPALRALTKLVLSSHGYTVIEAANGMEAMRLLEGVAAKADLLLSDVMMPGMSGLELAERVSQTFPTIRIAFMSGYSEFPLSRDGQCHVIEKPVAPDVLLARLRTILDSPSKESTVAAN